MSNKTKSITWHIVTIGQYFKGRRKAISHEMLSAKSGEMYLIERLDSSTYIMSNSVPLPHLSIHHQVLFQLLITSECLGGIAHGFTSWLSCQTGLSCWAGYVNMCCSLFFLYSEGVEGGGNGGPVENLLL